MLNLLIENLIALRKEQEDIRPTVEALEVQKQKLLTRALELQGAIKFLEEFLKQNAQPTDSPQ